MKEKKISDKDKKIKNKKPKSENNNKFIEIIKKRWLINGTKTILLVAIILGLFAGITILMQKLKLTPIDLTEEKLFTLTDESKEKIKNIGDNSVNIYFIEYEENDSTLDLARQYNKVNDKINVEVVTATGRPDLAEKYGIESGNQGIIVECGERYKVISSDELYTYDSETYETISVAEEKLTAAIKSVTTEDIPKIYFLMGYSEISIDNGMQYLGMYLQNEINDIQTLDILSKGTVPDDCNTLVITTPNKDFDELATNSIIEYINKGGQILWLNAATTNQNDYANVNKILALYGIKPFDIGAIRETDEAKMVSGSPDLIMPEIQNSDVTEKLSKSVGVIFINATKINTMSDEELNSLNVTKTDLIKTSENSYFRTNFNITSDEPQEGESKEGFLVGAQFDKKITNQSEETEGKEIKSKLIIYGENYFASDYQLTQNSQTAIVQYRQNKDLVLNSIAYLSNREENITVRKNTGTISYTATEQENKVILAIIITVPVVIILAGITVRIIRKRRK